MKVTQLALIAIVLLLGAGIFLLNKSESDRKEAEWQRRFTDVTQQLLQNQRNEAVKNSGTAPVEAAPAAPQTPVPAAEAPTPQPATVPPVAPVAPVAPVVAADPVPPTPAPIPPAQPLLTAEGTIPPATAPVDPALEASILEKETAAAKEALAQKASQLVEPDANLNPMALRIRRSPALCKVTEVQDQHGFVVLDGGTTIGMAKGSKFCVRRDYMIVGKIAVSEVKDDKTSIADIQPGSVPLGVSLRPGDELIQFQE
jgi:hypothetical protein